MEVDETLAKEDLVRVSQMDMKSLRVCSKRMHSLGINGRGKLRMEAAGKSKFTCKVAVKMV